LDIINYLRKKLSPSTSVIPAKELPVIKTSEVEKEQFKRIGIVTSDLNKAIQQMLQVATDRRSVYVAVEKASVEHPLMSSAVELYSDFSTSKSTTNNVTVWADAKSKEYQYQIDKLFDSINLEEVIYDWAYTMCLRGNTKINLLDGSQPSIKEMAENSKEYVGKYLWSVNPETMRLEVDTIAGVYKTRLNAELVRVHLDNGEYVDCTNNHRFMLRDGQFKEAKDLVEGESLMPLYTKAYKGGIGVYNPEDNLWYSKQKLSLTKDFLIENYVNKKFSVLWITKLIGCASVDCYLRKFGIPLRSKTETQKIVQNRNIVKEKKYKYIITRELLEDLYLKQMFSIPQISNIINVPGGVIADRLRRFNIPIRKSGWKGLIHINLYGLIHKLEEYKFWRKEVFERDSYTCQECGKIGHHLRSHHIIPFSILLTEFLKHYSQFSPIEDKEILVRLAMTWKPFWDISNGITLCEECHNTKQNTTYSLINSFRKENHIKIEITEKQRLARTANCLVMLSKRKEYLNHKVVRVERLIEREDVYDITTTKNHNFSVGAGVFVHNCLYGDMFVQINAIPGVGIVSVEDSAHPLDYSRVDVDGRLVGFFKTPGQAGMSVNTAETLLPPYAFAHFRLLGTKKRRVIFGDSATQGYNPMSMLTPDARRVSSKYGTSVLNNALVPYKRLKMAEDSLLMSRVVRGQGQRVFLIGVDKNSNADAVTAILDEYGAVLKKNLCLRGNTKISLLSGSNPTIKEMADDPNKYIGKYVYSINTETKAFEPDKIINVQKTRLNAELVRVHLDNELYIDCTPDHRFMLRDGEYKEAKDLIEGESLMPLYTRRNKDQRNYIFNPKSGKYELVFKTAFEFLFGKTPKGHVIHHKNFRKCDDDPSNLKFELRGRHLALHNIQNSKDGKYKTYNKSLKLGWSKGLTKETDERLAKKAETYLVKKSLGLVKPHVTKGLTKENSHICAKISKSRTGYKRPIENINKQKESRRNNFLAGKRYLRLPHEIRFCKCGCGYSKEVIITSLWQYAVGHNRKNKPMTEEHKQKIGVKNKGTIHSAESKKHMSEGHLGIKPSPETLKRRSESLKLAWARRKLEPAIINHKVVRVERLVIREDTYDITTERNHNFGLTDGIFVHNSLDISATSPNPYKERMDNLCLRGNTKISLLDGTEPTIEEMAEKPNEYIGKSVWTINEQTLELEPNKLVGVCKTRLNAELIRVHLDNEQYIDCTPDHRFMLRNGEYKMAKDLGQSESLMPLYTKIATNPGLPGYRLVYNPADNQYHYEHRLVFKKSNSEKPKRGMSIHHIDFNKLNNDPTNFELMHYIDHWAYHSKFGGQWSKEHCTGKTYEEIYGEEKAEQIKVKQRKHSFSKTRKNKTYIELYGENKAKQIKEQLSISHIGQIQQNKGKKLGSYDKIYGKDKAKIIKSKQKKSAKKLRQLTCPLCYITWLGTAGSLGAHINSCPSGPKFKIEYKNRRETRTCACGCGETFECIKTHTQKYKNREHYDRVIGETITKIWTERKQKVQSDLAVIQNHKVIRVEQLIEREDTYDIQIEHNHNFPVAAGVFLHNSAVEDIILPVWGDVNSVRIEKLGGEVDIKWIRDIEELRDQLSCALRVPLQLLGGYQKDVPSGIGSNNFERLDIRFSRQCRRIQRALIVGLTRLVQIHLAYQGKDPDLEMFELKMGETSTAENAELMEGLSSGADVVTKMVEILNTTLGETGYNKLEVLKYFNEKILHLSDFDFDKVVKEVEQQVGPLTTPEIPEEGEVGGAPMAAGAGENPFKASINARIDNSDLKAALPLNEGKNTKWEEQYGKAKIIPESFNK